MTETQIAPCPNPKCRNACRVTESGWGRGWYEVICGDSGDFCGYNGPLSKTKEGAIEGHNALCRSDALVKELEELRQRWYEKWNSAPYGSKEAEAISFCNDGVLALISKHRKEGK